MIGIFNIHIIAVTEPPQSEKYEDFYDVILTSSLKQFYEILKLSIELIFRHISQVSSNVAGIENVGLVTGKFESGIGRSILDYFHSFCSMCHLCLSDET